MVGESLVGQRAAPSLEQGAASGQVLGIVYPSPGRAPRHVTVSSKRAQDSLRVLLDQSDQWARQLPDQGPSVVVAAPADCVTHRPHQPQHQSDDRQDDTDSPEDRDMKDESNDQKDNSQDDHGYDLPFRTGECRVDRVICMKSTIGAA